MTRPGRLVLLGHPVTHSLSPVFQNAALRHAGIPLEYVALDVAPETLSETIVALRAERAAGNVTVPHKLRMHDSCDHLTPLARAAGAVNTFWVQDGVLHGDNTDVGGFDVAVRRIIDPPVGVRIAMLGAGGAALAVGVATAEWPGATLTVWNRSPERERAFVQRFAHARVAQTVADCVCDADLVVHATPTGLSDDSIPIDLSLLPRAAALFDLVYRPGGTALVRAARAAGHEAADGIGMLVEQGALAFERWFGVSPDREVMWRAVTGAAGPG